MNDTTITQVDARLLRLVGRYHYATAEQLRRASGYAMLNYTQTRLKKLRDAGYLRTSFNKRGSNAGSAPFIYSLSARGWQFLEATGVIVDQKKRPNREHAYSVVFYEHILGVVDVMIAADMLERSDSGIVIEEIKNELDIQRLVRTYNQENKTHFVEWDAWFDMTAGGFKTPIAIEYDRYTEDRKHWVAKIRRTVEMLEHGYETLFSETSVTIAVMQGSNDRAYMTSENRRDQLRRWTANELKRSGHEQYADLFLFTDRCPSVGSAEEAFEFFFGEHWYTPTSDTPTVLLESSHV